MAYGREYIYIDTNYLAPSVVDRICNRKVFQAATPSLGRPKQTINLHRPHTIRGIMNRFTTIAIAAVINLGCSSSDGSESAQGGAEAADSTDMMDHTACTGMEQVFEIGASVDGTAGHFRLELIAVDPAPHIGAHSFTVRITDQAGTAVENVDFNIDDECSEDTWCTNTWQHVHKHVGGSEVTSTDAGGGEYTVSGLTVVHAGSWEFRFAIRANGLDDYAVLHYCIEGDATDGADHTDHADGADMADMTDSVDMADMTDSVDMADMTDSVDMADMTDSANMADMTDSADGSDA